MCAQRAARQGSDTDEVLVTIDRIGDAEPDSWVQQWTTMAEVCRANGHCEPMARSLRDTRIYDWLEGYLR
jgi:hypothetical protein